MKTITLRNRLMTALLLVAVVSGCEMLDPGLEVNVALGDARGIRSGAAVRFNGVSVGEVKSVDLATDGVMLTLKLDREQAQSIQTNAAAMIETDAEPYLRIENSRAAAAPIADGAMLLGVDSSLEYTAWKAGSLLDAARQNVQHTSGAAKEYFAGAEWRATKQDMQDRIDDLQRRSAGAADKIEPSLRALLEDLESGGDAAAEQSRQHYDALKRQLSQWQQQGNEEFAEMLRNMLEKLETAQSHQPDDN